MTATVAVAGTTAGRFLGRDAELIALVRAVRAGRPVLVVGHSGTGRHRLVVEAGRRLGPTRLRTVRGTSGSAPLLDLRPLIGAAGLDEAWAAVDRALPGDAIVVVDEPGALDPSSAAILRQIGEAGRASLVGVTASPSGALGVLDGYFGGPDAETLRLGPLPEDVLLDLLAGWVDPPLDRRSALHLTRLSEGLPGFLADLVRAASDEGALVDADGVCRIPGLPPLGRRLARHVDARVAPHGAAGRSVLEVLHVAEQLPVTVAEQLAGIALLAAMEADGLLEVPASATAGAWVRVASPLVEAWLDGRMGVLGRRAAASRLAELDPPPAGAGDEAGEELRLLWAVRAGRPVDPAQATRCAQQAVAAGRVERGAELAVAAYALAPDAHTAVVASWNLDRLGEHEQAMALLERAASVVTDDWDRAWVAKRAAEERWWWSNDTVAARALADPGAHPPGAGRDLLVAQNAMFDLLDGRVAEARARAEVLTAHEHPEVRSVATMVEALGAALADHGDDALAIAEAARAEVAATDDPRPPGDFHVIAGLVALTLDGRFDDAAAVAELVAAGAGPGNVEGQGWAAMLAAFVDLGRGRLTTATEGFGAAEVAFRDCGLPGLARWCVTGQALANLARGDDDGAAGALARLDTWPGDGFALFEPLAEVARAWLLVRSGAPDRARAAAGAAVTRAAEHGSWALLGQVAHDLARLGLQDDAQRAAAASRGEGALTRLRLSAVAALAASDDEALRVAGEGLAGRGALLAAAECFVRASAVAETAGDARAAAGDATRAADLLVSCPEARTPLLDSAAVRGLSDRELEAARLARSGWSNRRIAEELGLSYRTVENHLYRAFAKLGIGGRDELAGVLDPPGAASEPT
ncbi:MAG: helix-turn-helix domain-containing protein [Acidimicrobiales bacterium]|nr:helix-turn-helix domain-containing protein [Acidimicrobiales bacterium]